MIFLLALKARHNKNNAYTMIVIPNICVKVGENIGNVYSYINAGFEYNYDYTSEYPLEVTQATSVLCRYICKANT